MGGDNAPAETVAGAIAAVSEGVDVVLVGDAEVLRAGLDGVEIPIVHASQTIEMGEDVTKALREKPDSSVAVCARLVRDGEADGFISAGSTGAAMAAATLILGRLPGVLRPTLASVLPTFGSPTIVLDSGANPDVKPDHLLQFAEMGVALSQVYFGVDSPRVGLLNIGQERRKGRQLEKDAYGLLEGARFEFVGNVEGRDVARDAADVIVTDGFTGNVFIKTMEGVADLVTGLVAQALADCSDATRQEVGERLAPITSQMDYENTGGAHLIGTAGVVVISHGSSTRRSIRNALHMAGDGADRGLTKRVAQRFAGR